MLIFIINCRFLFYISFLLLKIIFLYRNLYDLVLQSKEKLESVFAPTVTLLSDLIGKSAFRPDRSLNAAVCEAVMVGVATRLGRGPVTDIKMFKSQYEKLMSDADFLIACKTGTSDEVRVQTRLTKAISYFQAIG